MKTLYKLTLILLSILFLTMPAFAQTEDGQAYVIQVNDTLSKLADKYLGSPHAYPRIIEATAAKAAIDPTYKPISNPNLIVPGQTIWIPGSAPAAAALQPATEPPALTRTASDHPEPQQAGQGDANAPSGHLAFSFFNDHPGRCTYETNIINVPACLSSPAECQATRRIIPLNNLSEPALSPDGNRLAFRGWGEPPTEDNPYFGCAPAHPHRYLGHTTLDGTNFTGTGGFWEDSHPDWSPDGNRILFDTRRNGDGISRIFVINADGSNEQHLFLDGQQPSWAPDGERFVYRGCDVTGNRCGFWMALAFEPKSWERGINLIGPVIVGDQIAHPDWSPTREEIVYQRNENGNWNLWLVNVDGNEDRRLTSTANLEGLPAWSPDGNWVAYLTHDGRNWALRIISRDGTVDRPLFTYDGGLYHIPIPAEPYGVRDWLDEQLSWSR